jgi:hypothetical protein
VGKLTSHEQKVLEELERDLKAVRKAREALGDRAPTFGRGDRGDNRGGRDGGRGGRGGGGVLGKRRRGEGGGMESDDSDIPEDVRSIPMPRDTPPPIPKEVLDRWYQARRERYRAGAGAGQGTSANNTPLGQPSRRGAHLDGLPARPGSGSGVDSGKAASTAAPAAKTVYEAAPAIRDLRKEAVSKFVPTAVRAKMEKAKGAGALVEPEEAERLEREGYLGAPPGGAGTSLSSSSSRGGEARGRRSSSPPAFERRDPRAAMVEDADDDDEGGE